MVEDKFEVIKKGSTIYYKKNGWWHREDGPAIEYENGDQEWYIEGKLHRIGGPAYITHQGKYKEWYEYGKSHRLDGPAITYYDGYEEWYYKGLFITNESQAKFEKILKLKAFM
jgi:hypothetical protein